MVAVTTVLLRGVGVDAKIVADDVGLGTIRIACPVHAKFVGRTGEPTCSTMLEAGIRVDAAAIAQDLEVGAVDLAHAVFADFIVEAGLTAAATVQDIQIRADADTVAIDLLRVGTGTVRDIVLDEIGVLLTAGHQCNHREDQAPHMFWQ
jgi:hypothetical protein